MPKRAWSMANRGSISVTATAPASGPAAPSRRSRALSRMRGMSWGASRKWAAPAASAARGMPSKAALSGVWTRTRPPARDTASAPRAPSAPAPERITAQARSPSSAARSRRKRSMGRARPRSGPWGLSRRRPCSRPGTMPGGRMSTLSGCGASRSRTRRTGRVVWRERISGRALLRSGSRCWSTRKHSPVSGGRWEKNRRRASRPPAEAPRATIRGRGAGSGGDWDESGGTHPPLFRKEAA